MPEWPDLPAITTLGSGHIPVLQEGKLMYPQKKTEISPQVQKTLFRSIHIEEKSCRADIWMIVTAH